MSSDSREKTQTDQIQDKDQQIPSEPQVPTMASVIPIHVPHAFTSAPMEVNSPTALKVPLLTITSAQDLRATPSPQPEKNKNKNNPNYRECSNCLTSDSPIWRKGPNDDKLCNKCGLYWSRHARHRPIQITRARKKDGPVGGVQKRANSPRVNSPRINSPRINSPRINSPMPSSPLVTTPVQNANHFENHAFQHKPRFAYEEEVPPPQPGNLMLLLEAVQQSHVPKTPEDAEMQTEYKAEPGIQTISTPTDNVPGKQRRRTMDVNGSAFKAVVRELSSDQVDAKSNNSPSVKPKTISLVNRVLLM